jgi:hypothetical protein
MSAEIKPYRISVGDDVLDDLRLHNTRWPDAALLISGQCGPRIDLMQLSRTACISNVGRYRTQV